MLTDLFFKLFHVHLQSLGIIEFITQLNQSCKVAVLLRQCRCPFILIVSRLKTIHKKHSNSHFQEKIIHVSKQVNGPTTNNARFYIMEVRVKGTRRRPCWDEWSDRELVALSRGQQS